MLEANHALVRPESLLALLVALMMCGLVACSPPPDPTWERVQDSGVLRVGMDASFPPFASVAPDGSPVGLEADIAREVGCRLGLTPEFLANLPYDGLYDALKTERVDVVVSAVVVDPSRTRDYAYSEAYFDAGHVLVARAEFGSIGGMTDLADHALAVVLGTEGDREARAWARRLKGLDVVPHSTPVSALEAVRQGETDLALVDRVSALQATAADTPLVIVGEPVTTSPYACVVRRESWRLLEEIDEALQMMEDDGTMGLLMSTWLR